MWSCSCLKMGERGLPGPTIVQEKKSILPHCSEQARLISLEPTKLSPTFCTPRRKSTREVSRILWGKILNKDEPGFPFVLHWGGGWGRGLLIEGPGGEAWSTSLCFLNNSSHVAHVALWWGHLLLWAQHPPHHLPPDGPRSQAWSGATGTTTGALGTPACHPPYQEQACLAQHWAGKLRSKDFLDLHGISHWDQPAGDPFLKLIPTIIYNCMVWTFSTWLSYTIHFS